MSWLFGMPNVLFLIINQVVAPPSMTSLFCWAMTLMRKRTSAGASRLSAVPPMV